MVSELQVYKLKTVTCMRPAGDGAGDRSGVFMAAAATEGRGEGWKEVGRWGAAVPRAL